MIDLILDCLKNAKNINGWKINYTSKKSNELFYVRDKLEVARNADVFDTVVTIYINKDNKIGENSFSVYPYMNKEDIINKINDGVFNASMALNKFYELPKKEEVKIHDLKTNLSERPFEEIMKDVVEAVFKANKYENGFLNATEFFLYETNKRVINSNGVDVSSTSYSGEIELIPSWDTEEKEVEVYQMIRFGSLDKDSLTKQVDEVLKLAKARYDAVKFENNGEIPIIIQDNEVYEMLRYFEGEVNYMGKFYHRNVCEIGDSIQGKSITGTKISVKKVSSFPGCGASCSIDNDGVILKDIEVVKDGILLNRYGSNMLGYYLGIEKPTGILPITLLKPGEKSFEEMKKGKYLRCVKFSGLQVEDSTGFIGGEVRLGFYFDGEKEIPVTGFSISGNMHELKGSIEFSKEEVTLFNYHGPKYCFIKGMKIA